MNIFNTIPIYVRWAEILKRFLLIFLPLVLFFGTLTLLFYYKDVNTEQLTVTKSEFYKINSQMKVVRSKFKSIITDLQFLVMQSELSEYLQNKTPEKLNALTRELQNFIGIKKIYTQLQLLDENGLEVVLLQNDKGSPHLVAVEQLQDRAQQPYFQEARKLARGEVLVSPFDLNNSLPNEVMVEPVIRFSTPVIDEDGRHHGIIILNHPATYLIEDLETASINSPGQTMLVNPDGYYLNKPTGPANDSNISAIPAKNVETFIPEEWNRIKTEQSGQFTSPKGLITFNTIYPLPVDTDQSSELNGDIKPEHSKGYLWKTISFVPQEILAEWPKKILGRILLLYAVCLIVIAICSWLLARTSIRRKKAEEAMRENEEELRAINTAAANAIILIDNNKNVLHWNPAAERLFQYSAAEVVKKKITSIISPPKHQSTFTKISRQFMMPDPDSMEAKTIELYGYKKDGTEFPVEVSFSAYKSGEQWHTVGIIRDISARKEMEMEVLRVQKFESLGVLSSGIAHDFNNLLTAIIGNINLVGKLSGTSSDSLSLLQNAEKAAHRAKALTQQLLTFSKGGIPIRKTTAIDTIVKESIEYALHGSSIISSLDMPDDLFLVDIDEGQIGQVIQNIVHNSRQAISNSGAIHLRCRNATAEEVGELPPQFSGNYIAIEIRDTGHGITKMDLSKIYDPYFTTKDHGSGLGLTIAYSIIQRHDGYITVSSEEDIGSVFTVYLPAAVDQHLPKDKERKKGQGNHFKIMVVDNEEMLLNIASRMMVHLGHECICARTAREALDLYKHFWKTGAPVDGVIIDLTLPGGMGGKETAGAIFDINSEARIVVSSGYTNDPVMVDYDEYGFCAAIAKPFDMNELGEVIDSVFD